MLSVLVCCLPMLGAETNTAGESSGFLPTHDGSRLYYRKVGGGPQTVIIPGGFLFGSAFDNLAGKQRTVIFYDMRDRGQSDRIEDASRLTMENDVQDLETVRRYFGVKKFVPVGYSYLGFMVVLYAKDHLEHVERIVQLGPVPRQWDTEYPAHLKSDDVRQIIDEKAWNEVQELKKQGYDKSHPKEYCEKRYQVLRVMLVGNAKNADKIPNSCHLSNEWPVNFDRHLEAHFVGSVQKLKVPKEEVQKVSVPVLTIHGTKDRNAAYGAGREWALTLPDARLVTVKGAAHQSWADEPELVRSSIETFLQGSWPKEAEKITSLE
jgi:pimeloyl-ACP methyl ester carboxylesterase